MTFATFDSGYKKCTQQQGFSAHMGPFYEKCVGGIMHRALKVEAHHLNPEGVVHGGVSLAFTDYIIYRAIGDDVGHDTQFATINLNCNLLSAAKEGDVIYGVGSVTRKTRSVIFAEGHLFTESRPIIQATGVWKIIGAV